MNGRSLGRAHLATFAVALAGLAGAVHLVPEPVADRLLEADMRDAAKVWQVRILTQLDAGAVTFLGGAVTANDEAFLEAITHTSDIHRINLVDTGGRVFWSSRPELVGTSRGNGRGDGRGDGGGAPLGEVDYEVDEVVAAEVDDPALHVAQGDGAARRLVADIAQPVMMDGLWVGGIEYYRDITRMHAAVVARVRVVIGAMSGLGVVLLAALAIVQRRAARAALRAAEARAETQRVAAAEQLRLTREVRLLGELNEWLQSSRSLPELFAMVARFMAHILPGAAGSLYVYSNSRDVLDGAASWGGGHHHGHIRPEDCWGLRRGRAYAFGENAVDFACSHQAGAEAGAAPGRYVCLPIIAHGETVGLMSLVALPGTGAADFETSRRLAQTCAEQISMAIANVRMRDELQQQAIRDPLTGLFNRRHMLETLRRLADPRAGREVALVALDVDHFKRFNDNYGHDAGDMVLRAVGEALGRHMDGDDVACRVGGEEFTLLLPGLGPAAAAERAERVRRDVAELCVRYGDKALPRVTVSMGVAHHPTHGSIPQEVIRAADEALYAAKARGRDRVVLVGDGPAPGPGPGSVSGTVVAAAWAADLAEDVPGAELRRA